jgi:Icc-related predicted phosphoesterase
MKICFVSDLHADIGSQPSIQWPDADVLIIAGDTANSLGEIDNFFRKNSRKWTFPDVVTVDGNHEHYSNAPQRRTVAQTNDRLAELLPQGVHFLPSMGAVKIGDYYFIGRNSWYSFDSSGDPINNRAIWRQEMNDDKWIGFYKLDEDQNFQPQPWELAERHAFEIRQLIVDTIEADPAAMFVVVTHTAPHREMLIQRPEYLRTNPFYVNTRMEQVMTDFSERIVVWAHGHTHHRSEKTLNDVYVVANPRGYPGENRGWEPVVINL